MTSWKTPATSAAALCVFFVTTPAFADITADDVWADWKAYMASTGYEVTAEESRSGDTLTISDFTLSMAIPEEDATVGMTIPEMSLTDSGDGTVAVAFPPSMPLRMSIASPDGEVVDIVMDYTTKAFAMNVSGDPANMVYTYSAAELGIALTGIEVERATVDIGTIEMIVANMAGTTEMATGNIRTSSQRMATGAVSYNIDVVDPEGGEERIIVKGGVDSMEFIGTASLPNEMDVADMAAMLAAGFAFDGTFTYAGGGTEFDIDADGEKLQGSTSSASGNLAVAMDSDKLTYAGGGKDVAMAFVGGEVPFPVEISMKEAGFNLMMPIAAKDEEQDFAFGINFGDFELSDMIWGIFDQGGQLPRDPATVAIDLTGKAKLLVDLMNPEEMEKVDSGEMMPGELNALNINSLTVSAVGAALTGEGSFTFDNSDMTTFDGMPAPTGSVNLKLVGGNGLIDKLVGMGLLPEEQAMGARMMMGMFAVPGDGEDTLNSTIEVKGDGQVLANGQRLR